MTTIAVAIVGRVITIWVAIQKRSHEPIYKTHTKIEAKRLRATTFAIAKNYHNGYLILTLFKQVE